jgi:hypothetical protein
MKTVTAQIGLYPLRQASIGPPIRERCVAQRGVLLGVLNRWSLLELMRRLEALFRPTVYDAVRFYGVGELKRLLRTVSGGGRRIVWRTTLFPEWLPWQRATLPWGGCIAIALAP